MVMIVGTGIALTLSTITTIATQYHPTAMQSTGVNHMTHEQRKCLQARVYLFEVIKCNRISSEKTIALAWEKHNEYGQKFLRIRERGKK